MNIGWLEDDGLEVNCQCTALALEWLERGFDEQDNADRVYMHTDQLWTLKKKQKSDSKPQHG
jgi:hypothetical protein